MSFKQGFLSLNTAGTLAAPKTAAYSAKPEDTVIWVDSTGGAFSVDLPSRGIAEAGKFWWIINAGTSTTAVTITTEGSETINGAASVTVNASREALFIVSDGSNCSAVQCAIPA